MVKISIIVPVYNVERYVEKCLESLLKQTLYDIEIICIDDASSDASLSIVEEKAQKDDRIKIIRHHKNLGTAQARKHGVEHALGEYIMFVDSDDSLESIACEKLYNRIKKENVDILQYGTNVVPAVSVSNSMVQWVENFLKPYPKKVIGQDILKSCFVEDKFDFNITDKIWSSSLCKKAFSEMSDQKMIAAEDRYAFFLLAYFANSYVGIQHANYYNYNLGIGITGSDILDLERFEKRCTGALAVEAVEKFLDEQGKKEQYCEEYQQFENKILWDCVDCWINKLVLSDSAEGYRILLKHWDTYKVLAAIARTHFEDEKNIQERTGLFHKKQNCVIGIYCREVNSEYTKSIILEQKSLLEKCGNKVVILIDRDCEFDIESAVILPESKWANWDKYEERARKFEEIVKQYDIGLMLYMSPESHIAWLDELLIQSCNVLVMFFNYQNTLIDQRKKLLEQQVKFDVQYNAILNSRTYKVGYFLLWLPNKIRRIFRKVHKE